MNIFTHKLNKKGFTLAELLIVVAIIAVLVAIAVPIFMSSLEKARYATHEANARSLKGMAIAELLASDNFANTDFESTGKKDKWVATGTYNYGTETFELKTINRNPEVADDKVGMYCSTGEITTTTINTSAYKKIKFGADGNTIGKIGTGPDSIINILVVFTGADVSSVEIK